jgi:hypothetical protein
MLLFIWGISNQGLEAADVIMEENNLRADLHPTAEPEPKK